MEISIVIPVYNRKNELKNALQSLYEQSFIDFEVIIIDDGSTDMPEKVIRSFDHKLNINYIKLIHTGNLSYVRNIGTESSKGKYIAILDSDDQCNQKRLEVQHNYLQNNPQVDILATWVEMIAKNDFEKKEQLTWLYNMKSNLSEIEKRCLNYGSCLCHSTVMMKRELLSDLNGYNEEMHICEDFDLWLRALLKNKKIEILPQKLVYRKLHEKSITSQFEGTEYAIRTVIKIKLDYLIRKGYIKGNRFAIWGVNSRNTIVFEYLEKMFRVKYNIKVIDIYNELPIYIDCDYNFVTTYSSKSEVFHYLDFIGKEIVKDYIYL